MCICVTPHFDLGFAKGIFLLLAPISLGLLLFLIYFPTSGLSLAQALLGNCCQPHHCPSKFAVSPAATVSSASYKNDHVFSCFEHSSVPPHYFGKRHPRPLKIQPLLMFPARKPLHCGPYPRMQHSKSLPGPSAYWHCPPCLSTCCCQCCRVLCISVSHPSMLGPLCILHAPAPAVSASRESPTPDT